MKNNILKMILPNGCKGTMAPFGDDYCKVFLYYHGTIFIIGLFILFFSKFLGIAILLAAPIAALINLLLDR